MAMTGEQLQQVLAAAQMHTQGMIQQMQAQASDRMQFMIGAMMQEIKALVEECNKGNATMVASSRGIGKLDKFNGEEDS